MRMIKWLVCILLLVLNQSAQAKTSTLPNDVGVNNDPFQSCALNGTQTINNVVYQVIDCPANITLYSGNNNLIAVSSPVILNITGDLDLAGTDINVGGTAADIYINVGGNLITGNSGNTVIANLQIAGSILAGNNTALSGNLNITGDVTLGNNSAIEGNVTVQGDFTTGENVTVIGNIDAEDIYLGQNNTVEGNISGDDITISGNNTTVTGDVTGTGTFVNEGTIDGDVQVNCDDSQGETTTNDGTITGNVNSGCLVDNNGTVDGYINAPEGSDYGDAGQSCDFGVNEEDPCLDTGTVEFFQIVHDGSGVTCQAEPITLRACADSTCSSLATITGSFTLTATSASNAYSTSGSFDGSGAITASLPVPVADTYSLSLTTADAAANPAQCDLNGVNDCAINFADSGFLLSAPAEAQAGVDFTLTVQAVRTDTNTGACEAALNGTQALDLAMTCTDPAVCLQNASTGGVTITEAPSFASVSTDFGTNGTASLLVNYPDAGAISFSAQKTVGTGATLNGNLTNPVVVRPFAFLITTNPTSTAPSFSADYGQAPLFRQAGEAFGVTITAVNQQGNVTGNYGNESTQQRPELATTPTYVAPTGSGGSLVLASPLTFAGSGTGSYSSGNVYYTDVGVIALQANHFGNAYLGTSDVTGSSDSIGRFYPAYFAAAEPVAPLFANAQDDFTYLGQPLVFSANFPQLNFVPKSVQGATVVNYRDAFFNYVPDWASRSYTHLTSCDGQGPFTLSFSGTSSAQLNTGNDTDTAADFTVSLPTEDGLRYTQDPTVATPPFAACAELAVPAAALTDSDGVCVKSGAAGSCLDYRFTPIEGTELLDGRLSLLPAYGAVNDVLDLEFAIEYFNGTIFITNSRDNSTQYSDNWITPESTRFTDFVSAEGLTAASLAAQALLPTPVLSGQRQVTLPLLVEQSVSPGLSGSFNWILNLNDIGLPWLQYQWEDECSPATNPQFNPCAPLVFGLFRGNDRIIYQRETGW
ncbi:DUF6701 domain-containing protein [Pseudidiomarina sp.]|uniref:DUF6701 domain-containing protein n=1 Tax=Pseudidiomarina sp. TaxID=2081707 RepID=UPI00299E5BAB|nr:DUF6701 domain-containing protein [Pseudidiomarina sp.]MDX1706298.1 DUF6701 domain-containing protein [Pseudidiomarina sp.]